MSAIRAVAVTLPQSLAGEGQNDLDVEHDRVGDRIEKEVMPQAV
jgi:hypothetical protein